ncbi:hypothetical protein P2318_33705 [Myxococcaceae bacterium GXIMD 01537]
MKRLITLLALVLVAGCDTGQQRRTFPVVVTALPMSGPNEKGWTVQPEALQLSAGPVRFFEGRVLLSRRAPRFDAWALLGVGTAWAHPGHYIPGDALGELLAPKTVDLLASEPTPLGEASAVTGSYGSMELTLTRAAADVAAPFGALAGQSVRVRGTATGPQGQSLRFEARVALEKPIEGIRFEKELAAEERGRVRIAVDLGKWLGRIDFATASQQGADGEYTFPSDSQAQNALARGVEDTSAYVVTWEGAE